MAKVLILTDGKAGHENQSKALARQLGYEPELVEVHFTSKGAKTLSYLYDHLGVYSRKLLKFATCPFCKKDEYAAVIGTGSGTFYAAKTYAKLTSKKCAVVLYPRGYKLLTFDCILAPSFDKPAHLPNVVEIPANLVANDEEFYKKGTEAFLEKYTPKKDAVAVIVGGPNKCSTMTAEWMKKELDKIFKHNEGKEFWVTTSRRTPLEVEAVVDAYPFDYKLLYSRDHFNPIPAFVSLAKKLYVSAESTGMLSEACTFGTAEVEAMDNLHAGPHKFRHFVELLTEAGYLGGNKKIDLAQEFAAVKRLLNG